MNDELVLQTANQIKLEDAPVISKTLLESQADRIISDVFDLDSSALRAQQQKAVSIRELGVGVQREIYRRSTLLKQPMSKLVNDAEEGSDVSNALLALQEQTDKINPNRYDFSMSAFRRLVAMIPGVGTPISRWFAKYQSVESVIQTIVKSLEYGRQQLERDNTTLKDDQIVMRELTFKLQNYIELGRILDSKMTVKLSEKSNLNTDKKQFIEEEVVFPLRQRIIDLQQQLAVNQQGVLTTEVIIRNNRELVRGVSRSLNVTITALNIAATLALALQNQKNVLKGVEAVNKTTDNLLSQTAKNLKIQGVEIHKQAVGAQLDIGKLKMAFEDVHAALKDMSSFRRQALPQMSQSIEEMGRLTTEMNGSIKKLESGDGAQITLDFE